MATIERIRDILSPLGAAAVYVFGSVSAGAARPDSDLDLAVLPEQPLAVSDLFEAKLRSAEALGRDVDLIDLSIASTGLRKEVLTAAVSRMKATVSAAPNSKWTL